MKFTRAITDILESKSESESKVNVKLPFYCIRILNLLEKEPTMFQDSIRHVSQIVEKYIFCTDEETLQELSQTLNLSIIMDIFTCCYFH